MADARLRLLQRAHQADPTEESEGVLLHERLRMGEECRRCEGASAFELATFGPSDAIDPCPTCGGQTLAQRIKLAAYIGHPAALRVCGYGRDWTQCGVCGVMFGPEVFLHDCQEPALTWVKHLATFGQVVAVRVALAAGRVALLTSPPPGGSPGAVDGPAYCAAAAGLRATEAWLGCPCARHHAECARRTNDLSQVAGGAARVTDAWITDAWIAFGLGILTDPKSGATSTIARNQIPACVRLGATELNPRSPRPLGPSLTPVAPVG